MIKLIILFAVLLPQLASALSHPCLVIGRSVDMSMINAMSDDMGISRSDINMDKTTFKLLGKYPVDRALAEYLTDRGTLEYVTREQILEIYTEDEPENLIVEYTYYNQKNQENIFIGSNVVNNNECSVKFTGYIIVKREF